MRVQQLILLLLGQQGDMHILKNVVLRYVSLNIDLITTVTIEI